MVLLLPIKHFLPTATPLLCLGGSLDISFFKNPKGREEKIINKSKFKKWDRDAIKTQKKKKWDIKKKKKKKESEDPKKAEDFNQIQK